MDKISTRFNKATVAALAGAVITVIAAFVPDLTKEVQGALQTLLVTLGVILVGNRA